MNLGQTVELYNRILGEAFIEIACQPLGLYGVARQSECNGRFSLHVSAT
jgi:hypothetical protein